MDIEGEMGWEKITAQAARTLRIRMRVWEKADKVKRIAALLQLMDASAGTTAFEKYRLEYIDIITSLYQETKRK